MKKLVAALTVLGVASILVVTFGSDTSGGETAGEGSKRTGAPRPVFEDPDAAGSGKDVAPKEIGPAPSTEPPRDVVVSTEPQSPRPETPAGPVDPSAIGNEVGASDPAEVILGDIEMVTDHEILEDVTIRGCVTIEADDVTLRNVVVECAGDYPIKDNGSRGTRIERVTLDCIADPDKGIFFELSSDFGVDRIEVRNCDDQFFIDGGLGDSWITNSVFHQQGAAGEAHTDGAQIATFETTTGTLWIEGNWWEYDREGCCDNAVVFISGEGELTLDMRRNYLDGDFGTHLVRCYGASSCVVEDNTIGGTPSGLVVDHPSPRGGRAGCNRFLDGRLVPSSLYSGVTVSNRGC